MQQYQNPFGNFPQPAPTGAPQQPSIAPVGAGAPVPGPAYGAPAPGYPPQHQYGAPAPAGFAAPMPFGDPFAAVATANLTRGQKLFYRGPKALLEQRIEESRDFFTHTEMVLDLCSRPLRTDEISELHGLLVEKPGVKVVEVKLNDELSLVLDRIPRRPAMPAKPPVAVNRSQEECPVIVRNTCRSGIRIEAPADCIVLGDVNPGAEIVAVGDVIVSGNLRGIAHAGASGDRSARIWALSIEPSQIRIADMVAVPPQGSKPRPKRFEIAEIQQNLIEVITL